MSRLKRIGDIFSKMLYNMSMIAHATAAIYYRSVAFLKLAFLKAVHPFSVHLSSLCGIFATSAHFTLSHGTLKLGKRLKVRRNVNFSVNGGELCIGDHCFFNHNCCVAAHEKIVIGERCSFGPGVMLFDHDHDFRAEGGKNSGKFKTAPIKIGNNVWLGTNVIVLRGVTIGDNAVVGAGTVVKHDIPSNTVVYPKVTYISKQF